MTDHPLALDGSRQVNRVPTSKGAKEPRIGGEDVTTLGITTI